MPSRSARCRFAILAALATTLAPAAQSQELQFPADSAAEATAPPTPTAVSDHDTSYQSLQNGAFAPGDVAFLSSGSGAYYNSTLGAHLRAAYQTRSYGQQEGTFNLGTMKLLEMDEGFAFLDGQVTMNDDSGVGYNLGVGYRWMTLPMFPWSPDDEKIMGVSIWSDGQTIDQEEFFPQVGVSLEMLGERIDFRANGYIPVGADTRDSEFASTATPMFVGNSLIGGQTSFTRTTSLTAAEAEIAGRIANLDAWIFGGVYGFNDPGADPESQDTVGGKIGLRGYATPDLLLSIAITNDDVFDTNAVFNATWFIGRTRAENCPVGVLADRYREPVIRNNYVATRQRRLTENNDALATNFVHVDSNAAAGGDGTFENPLNSLAALGASSSENDNILVRSGSAFTGETAALQNGQTFLGEGGGAPISLTIAGSAVELPETSVGAAAGNLPTIDGGAAAAITLANDNTVRNFTIAGGSQAIDATGAANPNIDNISVTGGGGFLLANVTGAATVANSSLTGTTTPAISFTGGTGTLSVDAMTTITDVVGDAIVVSNNQGEATIDASVTTDTTVDGGTVSISNNQALVTLNGGISANNADALRVVDADAGINAIGAISHSGTFDAVSVSDTVVGNTAAAISVSGAVTNTGGRSVFVDNSNDAVTFVSGVDDDGDGIQIQGLAASGAVGFGGIVDVNTTAGGSVNPAVNLAGNNTASQVDFTQLNITTTTGEGLVSDGGVLNVTDANSSISTTGQTALSLTGGSSTNGVNFATVDASNVAGASGIVLTDFNVTAPSGVVDINGGTISTTGANVAVDVENTSLDLAGVTLNAGGSTAINALYDGGSARTLSVGGELSNDGVTVNSTGAGNNTVSLTNVTGLGDSTFALTGAGDLDANLVGVNGPGTVDASSTAPSSGDLSVDIGASGITEQLGAINIDDLGAGDLTVTSTGSTTSSTFDVSSSGTGDSSVTLTGLTAGGSVSIDNQSPNGALTATVNGGTSITGNLSITSNSSMEADVTVDNVSATGNITIDDQGAGALTAAVSGGTSTGGNLAVTTTGAGDASVTINNVNATGTITADATNTDAFVVDVDGGGVFDTTGLRLNAGNTGDVTYSLDNLNFTTGTGTDAIELVLGANVATANVSVVGNSVTTGNGQAFDFDVNGGGTVNFLLRDNAFTNDSGPDLTAFVDIGGGTTINTTIEDNTFTNNNAGPSGEFEISRTAGAVNLNLLGNNALRPNEVPAADGTLTVRTNAAGEIDIFLRDDTFNNTNNRNDVQPTFITNGAPSVLTDFDVLGAEPTLPTNAP